MAVGDLNNCMIEYKDFICHFAFNEKDKLFHGRVANNLSLTAFEGKSVREIHEVFYRVVDEHLEWLKKHKNKEELSKTII